MSLISSLSKLARSPKGKALARQGVRYASSPKGKAQIASLRQRLAARGTRRPR